MDDDKDLIIHQEYQGNVKSPLVSPPSILEQEMYNQIAVLNKQMKAIKKILEVNNEK